MKRLVQVGTMRRPRGRVFAEGAVLPGVLSIDVSSNAHYQADTFRLKVALHAAGGPDLNWWGADARKGGLFDVRLSLDGRERRMIVGEADKIDVHPETGEIGIEGRDLTSRFIDNRIQEAFINKTASDIATMLAGRRGLTPIVTATSTPVSRYYAADHDRVQHDQFSHVGTEWDLLSWLAQQEKYDCFVDGTELHFQPAVDPSKAEPYGVRWSEDRRQCEVTDLNLGRSLTLAKDVVVVVRSWHSAKGKGFSRTSQAGGASSKGSSGKAQRYTFTRPNLTEDQAQKEADRLRAEITKHERTLSFKCPGELDLTPRDVLSVSGCGGWDQRYFVDTIARTYSMGGGLAQSVTAKNRSVESQAAAP